MSTVLGKTYVDVITGFAGVATAKIQYLTGCEQTGITPRELRDGKPMETVWFDDPKLSQLFGADDISLNLGGINGADFAPPSRRG